MMTTIVEFHTVKFFKNGEFEGMKVSMVAISSLNNKIIYIRDKQI